MSSSPASNEGGATNNDGGDCYEDLNLTFDDIEEDFLLRGSSSSGPSGESSHGAVSSATAAAVGNRFSEIGVVVKQESAPSSLYANSNSLDNNYILGTLVVRVVAARDLEAVHKTNPLGNLLFGSGLLSSSTGGPGRRSSSGMKNGGGTANPYASVRFGNSTQRTSEVFETTDPIWPRGEAMYLDVTHAEWDGGAGAVDAPKFNEPQQQQNNHPGNPPQKHAPVAATHPATQRQPQTNSGRMEEDGTPMRLPISSPILTVAIFHANDRGSTLKFPTKGGRGASGDSDDVFLGMTCVDLTRVITGKIGTFDEWLFLQGTSSAKASVRIVCEYETSDAPPQPGDIVKFTDFCNPTDLYPVVSVGRLYTVQEIDGDEVLISYTSVEGWVSTFQVHRFMLICVERHHSVMDKCQDELASFRERIAHSPMVHVVQQSVERIPDEGLLNIGVDVLQNGASLLSRWWQNGIETTAQDLTFATNWDGRHNPSTTDSLATTSMEADESDRGTTTVPALIGTEKAPASELDASRLAVLEALPNMPPCPITGEPMRDPVVAADGHTYERFAIARWLTDSNKSPLTGAILSHKDLVPNYMLLTSLQEASTSLLSVPSSSTMVDSREQRLMEVSDDEDATAEVNIND